MSKPIDIQILDYWWDAVMIDGRADRQVNDLLENFVKRKGHVYDGSDIYRTIRNLTKSEQRNLLKQLKASGIVNRRCGDVK